METPSVVKAQAREWVDRSMRHSALWAEFQYSTIMYGKKDTVFVVWEYHAGLPRLVAALVVEKPYISFVDGVALEVHDLVSDRRIVLDQKPAQIVPGVFAWIPAFLELRYAPRKYNDNNAARHLTVPFCVKTATHPTKSLTEGHRYISTQKEFEARWPNFK